MRTTQICLVLGLIITNHVVWSTDRDTDPWMPAEVITLPKALWHEEMKWILESEKISSVIEPELKFQRPVYPIECRHLDARIAQVKENHAWARVLDENPRLGPETLLPLLDFQWAQWSEIFQEPLADYQWNLAAPKAGDLQFWKQSFKMILQNGLSESSSQLFPIRTAAGFSTKISDDHFIVNGTLNRLDICQNKKVQAYAIENCEINKFSDLKNCQDHSVFHFEAPLALKEKDSALSPRKESSPDLASAMNKLVGSFKLNRCQVDLRFFSTCTGDHCEKKLLVYAEDPGQKNPGALASFLLTDDDFNLQSIERNAKGFRKQFRRAWNIKNARYYQVLILDFDYKWRLQSLDTFEGRNTLPTFRKRTLCKTL